MKKVVLSLEHYSWVSKYKYLVIMKIIMALLLSFLFQVQAETIAQTVTISKKNAKIVDVFREIKKQTGYNIVCNSSIIEHAEKLDVNLKAVPMETALNSVLKSNGLTYKIENKNIVVQRRPEKNQIAEEKVSVIEVQQNIVKGTVKDQEGTPMKGVSVSVKGTTRGTSTDDKGKYEVSADIGEALVFTSVGYLTKEVLVTGSTQVDAVLEVDEADLDEVVVVAYGTQKKESMVSAIQSVSVKDLRVPSSNLTTSFAGRIAGMIAYQRSGEPGQDNAEFFIRGVTSFGAGKIDPLILIDNVEMST